MNLGDQCESEVVTFMAPHKQGWLSKQNHNGMKSWKKHWFVLTEHVLYYLHAPGQKDPRLILPMDNVRVGRGSTDTVIKLVSADGKNLKITKNIDGSMELQSYKSFYLKATNKAEREDWFKALEHEMEQDPVQRSQRLKMTRATSSQNVSTRDIQSSKQMHKLKDRGPLELPKPIAMGWMQKRGEGNSAWKRRYFALIDPPAEQNIGIALYYFGSPQLMDRMLELGEQTQKGQLFLEKVNKVRVIEENSSSSRKPKSPIIELVCTDRTWIFRPDDFEYWIEFLRAKCSHASEKLKL
mmetsp:Transcript_51301/g.69862  ORF Transcript_51301/g.69862 Transcript_51301/m.69862 type:complete len:296 (-) Transcript_51301:201-1088(-)